MAVPKVSRLSPPFCLSALWQPLHRFLKIGETCSSKLILAGFFASSPRDGVAAAGAIANPPRTAARDSLVRIGSGLAGGRGPASSRAGPLVSESWAGGIRVGRPGESSRRVGRVFEAHL